MLNQRRITLLRSLSELIDRKVDLSLKLKPFYDAHRLLGNDDPSELEHNTDFRPIWLELEDVRRELSTVMNDLAW